MSTFKRNHEYIELKGKGCVITIEERPAYCDQGNYLAKIFPTGDLARDMDAQDGWPRYYFDLTRAIAECEAWLAKRRQNIPKPKGKNEDKRI